MAAAGISTITTAGALRTSASGCWLGAKTRFLRTSGTHGAYAGRDGKRKYTVAQIAAEFDVSRPTIYRHLPQTAA